MRLFIGLILLAFPIAEIWLLIELAQRYGWWLLLYLIGIGFLGIKLIIEERLLFTGRMMESLRAGGSPAKAMFGSLRNIIAGFMLFLPGVITDIIAVVLLLIPIKNGQLPNANDGEASSPYQARKDQAGKAANDDVIEGEFRRED